MNKLSIPRTAVVVCGLLLIALSWRQVLTVTNGLVTRSWVQDGVPLFYAAPAGAQSVPGVVIGHGFSGSNQLMRGYSMTLARAGYATISVDFTGHAANPRPLNFADTSRTALEADLSVATAALASQPGVDNQRIALLGHSMGSGVVMMAGIAHPEQYAAVIAISPTSAEVTPQLPHNLQLQAGQLEPQFAANAERLLAAAGGPNPSMAEGVGREFISVPFVEHISILFSHTSQQAAVAWLGQAFGLPTAAPYRDWRMAWYGVHLAAVVAVALATAPLWPVPPAAVAQRRKAGQSWGLVVAPFLATGLMALLAQLVPLSNLGGLLVGGSLGLWFALFGLLWLGAGGRPLGPQTADWVWGAALFGLLTIAFGVLAHIVWLPWWMIGTRLVRWPFLWLACLPWQLAAGLALHGAGRGRVWLWWLGQSIFIVAGVVSLVAAVPSTGFLMLVVPLVPLLVGLMTLLGRVVQRPWAFALGNAAFFAWVIVVVFPLAS